MSDNIYRELAEKELELVIGGQPCAESERRRAELINDQVQGVMKSKSTPTNGGADVPEVQEKTDVCRYCNNDNQFDLTTCGNCSTTFCIYCVATGHVDYETYDICPSCKKTFEW